MQEGRPSSNPRICNEFAAMRPRPPDSPTNRVFGGKLQRFLVEFQLKFEAFTEVFHVEHYCTAAVA